MTLSTREEFIAFFHHEKMEDFVNIYYNNSLDVPDNSPAQIIGATKPDTQPLVAWTTGGTNGATVDYFVTNRDPNSNVVGDPGSICFRSDGVDSKLYIHTGSSSSDSDWLAFNIGPVAADNLATTLAVGNTTGGKNIVVSSGDKILAPEIRGNGADGLLLLRGADNSPTAGSVIIRGGNGSTTGGKVRFEAGSGGTNAGDFEFIGVEGPNGQGSAFLFVAGNGGPENGSGAGGGFVFICGGGGFDSGDGGSFSLTTGLSEGPSAKSGSIDLDIGNTQGGLIGNILLAKTRGKVGIGTSDPKATLEVGGTPGDNVGGFASGNLHVTGQSALENANAVITGHNLFNGNKQLWYLGSASSSNDNVTFLNRQVGSLALGTNNIVQLTIEDAGDVVLEKQIRIKGGVPGINKVLTSDLNGIATWESGGEVSNVTVYVRSLADLPTPVGGVIALASNIIYKFLNNVDVGTNQLKTGINTALTGLNAVITTLSGTTTVPLIITNGSDAFDVVDMTVSQLGSGDLMSISMTTAQDVTIIRNSTLTGGIVRLVKGFGFITTNTFFQGAQLIQDGTGGGVDSINLSGLSALLDLTATDGTILFESGSTTDSFIMGDGAIILLAASVGIRVGDTAVITSFNLNSTVLQHLNVSATIMVVENPDDITLGSLVNNAPTGIGKLTSCEPTSESNFPAVNADGGTLAFDGVNLISARQQPGGINQITLHVGVTSSTTSTITSPDTDLRGITWARGNLVSIDGRTIPGPPTITLHDGFSISVLDSFTAPGSDPRGITYDGTNLISVDGTLGIKVHDGITSTIIETFASPAGAATRDIDFDGINLIVCDSSNTIYVMKGISATVQYTFTGPDTLTNGVTITDVGAAIADTTSAGTIFVFNHPIAFDHSSSTWVFLNNANLVDSSNRGGSQFTNGVAGENISLTQNIWTDVSDSGANIFYASFSTMEKCRLNNEQNGEVIWKGARDKGQLISGLATLTRSGSGLNRFYEAAIVINGIIQKDSITSNVLPDTSTFATLQTLPITKCLTKDDVVKVQIRNTTDSQDALAISVKLSIN